MIVEVIDDKTNRIKDLAQFGTRQEFFHLDLRVTSKCNYSCYYCTDMHCNNNPIVYFNLENIKCLADFFKNRNKKLHVFIYGGEPTLHPQLIDIISIFGSSLVVGSILEVQSNYSKPLSYIKTLCLLGKKYKPFILSGSVHNTQTKFIHTLPKFLLAKSLGVLGMVTFMYNSTNNIIDDFNTAKSLLGLNHVEISPLISSSVTEDPTTGMTNPFDELNNFYEKENPEDFSKHTYTFQRVIPYKLNNSDSTYYVSRGDMWYRKCNSFTGMICDVSKERLIVDWNGDAYSCFNSMFSCLNKINSPLFNINDMPSKKSIYEKLDSIIHKQIICPYRKCFFELEHKKQYIASIKQ